MTAVKNAVKEQKKKKNFDNFFALISVLVFETYDFKYANIWI